MQCELLPATKSSMCFFPLLNAFFPDSPIYIALFPKLSQRVQIILYTTPGTLQLTLGASWLLLHGKHSESSHLETPQGSFGASIFFRDLLFKIAHIYSFQYIKESTKGKSSKNHFCFSVYPDGDNLKILQKLSF